MNYLKLSKVAKDHWVYCTRNDSHLGMAVFEKVVIVFEDEVHMQTQLTIPLEVVSTLGRLFAGPEIDRIDLLG
jgi:hypothetical protein